MNDWHEVIAPPTEMSERVERALTSLDPLKLAWEEAARADPEGFTETRIRTLRSHAIETGIIERLYDVEWGLTQSLVAEGFALEVVQRAGTLDGDVLAIINDQFDALLHVSTAATGGGPLTVQFIRELHQIITKHQSTYEAIDTLGRVVHPPLHHGEWKKDPNQLIRPNGSLLNCTPPERVQDQMESLVGYFSNSSQLHPIVRAAWLHHCFACIHPFEDGNGRVGRALVLLDLVRGHFAPLVVNRTDRDDYLLAMDRANDGDLDPLILEFAELERQAMVRQFQAPLSPSTEVGVIAVARVSSAMLADLQAERDATRAGKLATLAKDVAARIATKLDNYGKELKIVFKTNDAGVKAWVESSSPGEPGATYQKGQLVKLAKLHGFYANLTSGTWWSLLSLELLNEKMRFLAAVVKVGAGETGVATLLVQAERPFQDSGDSGGRRNYEWLFEPTTRDQITFTYEAALDDIWPEIDHLLDRALAAAIAEFIRNLG